MPSKYAFTNQIPQHQSETIIRLLATHCKYLRELFIPNVVVSQGGLEFLHNNLYGLEELSIIISPENQSATHVIGRFDTLTRLSLLKHPNDLLSDHGVLSPIRFGCPNLTMLDFEGFDRGIAVEELNLLIASKVNVLRTFYWTGVMHSSTLMALGE